MERVDTSEAARPASREVILLDTHVVFWLNSAPEKLSKAASRAIRRGAASSQLGIASISLWELAMHVERGWIRLRRGTLRDFIEAVVQTPGLSVVELDPEIAVLAAQLPRGFPSDPADRVIAATGVARGAALVTKDQRIQDSGLLRTIW